MRQALRPGALGRPGGSGWRGRWEGGIGMGKTCKLKAVSIQCMTKFTTNLKKKKLKKKKKSPGHSASAYGARLKDIFHIFCFKKIHVTQLKISTIQKS